MPTKATRGSRTIGGKQFVVNTAVLPKSRALGYSDWVRKYFPKDLVRVVKVSGGYIVCSRRP